MTISLTVYEHYYDGNGSTLGPHTISFPFFATADVIVEVGGVTKTLSTHYTITPGSLVDGHYNGGTLNFTAGNAPANGTDNIYIACNTPAVQNLDLATVNTFDPASFERVLDRNVMVARDAYAKAARANTNALEDLIALYQTYVDACEAAQAAAELAETNAETAETNAETAATNAATSASNASSSASAASTSATTATAAAASASAIANGDLFAFANTTGNFTAINNAAYYVDDGAQITLPAIGTNVNFRVYCKTQPPVTGITFLYTSNTIQGLSSNVTIKNTGVINCFAPNATTWQLTKGSMSLLSNSASSIVRAVTGNSSILVDDDTIVANITSNATLTLHNPALTSKIHTIKNSATSSANITIARYASENIEGVAASYTYIYPGQAVRIQATGTDWIIL